MISVPCKVGMTKISSKNQVSLPAKGLRMLGWERGDQLIVKVLGDDTMLLTRRPTSYAEKYSGKMGDVFGDPEDVRRFLDEERRSWEEWENRWEHDR